mgnify:FL=1
MDAIQTSGFLLTMRKRKDDFLKKIIIALGIFLLCFTAVNLFLFYATGTEPSTLITCVFGACIGEYSVCGFIKTVKEKQKKNHIKMKKENK